MSLIPCTQGFLGSLIMNMKLDFQDLKWRIQYGGRLIDNFINSSDTSYSGVFGVADYESEIRFSKFKIVDPIWWMPNRKFHKFFRYLVLGGS